MKHSAGVGSSRVRLAVHVVLLLAAGVALYAEMAGPVQFLRVGALLGLVVTATLVVERNRSLELLARATTERETMAGAWANDKERAESLERLLQFGQRIGNFTDTDQLRSAVLESLPPLVRTRDIWMTSRVGGWHEVFRTGPEDAISSAVKLQRAWETFPLRINGKTIGVLGVRQEDRAFTLGERTVMLYAASIIAIALKNVQLFQKIKEQSTVDPLTGCSTRAHGIEVLSTELRRAARSGTAASLLMIDADHFKKINDTCGHQFGDEVLRLLGHLLKTAVRTTDLACRYGGEEFLVILPDTSTAGAAKLAESIRRAVEAESIVYETAKIKITISCGIATSREGELDPTAVVARADVALYQAKSQGRNRVLVHGQHAVQPTPKPTLAQAQRSDPPVSDRRDLPLTDRRRGPGGRRSSDLVRFQS